MMCAVTKSSACITHVHGPRPLVYVHVCAKWHRSVSTCEEAHDLQQKCTAGEKRSLDVRAHLRRLGEIIRALTDSGKEIAGLKEREEKCV